MDHSLDVKIELTSKDIISDIIFFTSPRPAVLLSCFTGLLYRVKVDKNKQQSDRRPARQQKNIQRWKVRKIIPLRGSPEQSLVTSTSLLHLYRSGR